MSKLMLLLITNAIAKSDMLVIALDMVISFDVVSRFGTVITGWRML